MKTKQLSFTFLLVFLFLQSGYAQKYLSTGFTRRVENFDDHFFHDFDNRTDEFRHQSLFVRFEHVDSIIYKRFQFSISQFKSDFDFHNYEYEQTGPHGIGMTRTHRAKFGYQYAAFTGGLGLSGFLDNSVFKETRTSFYLGVELRIEFLLRKETYDHKFTESYSGWSNEWGEDPGWTEISYEPFSFLGMRQMIPLIGIQAGFRTEVKRFFFGLDCKIGKSARDRIQYSRNFEMEEHEKNDPERYVQSSIHIGWRISKD